jgi:hypothetical protein
MHAKDAVLNLKDNYESTNAKTIQKGILKKLELKLFLFKNFQKKAITGLPSLVTVILGDYSRYGFICCMHKNRKKSNELCLILE